MSATSAGFTGEFECTSKGFTCPKCGNHDAARVSVTRRVCGISAARTRGRSTPASREEAKRRVKHSGQWADWLKTNALFPDSGAQRPIPLPLPLL
ncbi:hypothetical protein LNQ03_14160 [Klebsiella pneumoniae subsp. pneumoniae]|nr:hypothetical protein [Klebsiella pneumoniae subsp. pneumoniae]